LRRHSEAVLSPTKEHAFSWLEKRAVVIETQVHSDDALTLDPEGDFFRGIVDDKILHAIGELQEEYRTAVVLSDIDGLSYQDISNVMEVPVGTVKSRLFRGRRQLQKKLYDYAVEEGFLSGAASGGN